MSIEYWKVNNELNEVLYYKAQSKTPKLVLLLIPGNPGVVHYYKSFLEVVFNLTNKRVDIICVQHLGHAVKDKERKYLLRDQVDHKINFFDYLRKKKYKSLKNLKFVLSGHSIGAYMAIELYQNRLHCNIIKVIPLFPTLHSMLETPNGKKLNLLFNAPFRNIASTIVSGISFLNELFPFVVISIIRFITKQSFTNALITCNHLLKSNIVYSALYLANDEMKHVTEIRTEVIEALTKKQEIFTFYYGATDEWSPIDHYYQMKMLLPNAEVYLCEDECPHAFVLEHGDIIGKKVANWILNQKLE
ncbi:hypothetical protein HK099_005463 [Clydaea vesicula]|uniref:Lipid droplet-associated serine hydrolase n=1 Tax=Clydaea vesicula TaxID=447962 RepID=A0AAD5TZD8_9FUNG|nr:hypothetical protein HK099_005463 [Clydaea vesicula]